jgi:hypothetical protein
MKKYLGIAMVLVILLVSISGCASTTTVTTTEQTTLPAVTITKTVTVTNSVTTTVNTTVTATSTSTVTATTTNVMTTTATASVTTTATKTVNATVTSTVTTTVITTSPTTPTTTTTITSTSVGVPVGTVVNAIIIVEEIVPGGFYKIEEPHNISMTVMEVVRGSKAWDMVKAADASNKAPDAGYEYLLARVKFAYGSGGGVYYTLKREYFKVYSSANKEYASPVIVDPKPALINGTALYQGQSTEGWVSFVVSQDDSKPVMIYTEASSWFRLY